MINRLYVDNFKCFSEQDLPLAQLTILAGANASGKTSLIQALLLLRQSYDANRLQKGELVLAGELVSVGVARDAINATRPEGRPDLLFEIQDDAGVKEKFCFGYETGQGNSYVLYPPNRTQPTINLCQSALFTRPLPYLCAERLGPRLAYPIDSRPTQPRNVGIKGQYTAYCLATYGDDPLANQGLEYPGSREEGQTTLTRQTQLWMREIVPELELEVEQLVQADQVRIGLRNQGLQTGFLRPPNIGFGISYALAVVVAVLVSERNSVLLLENPEAHLHPFSQSKLGSFLARAASAGLQIIVETHSDHLLNGIRLAVKRKHLLPEQTAIHFFSTPIADSERVVSPRLDADGRIQLWPSGFFDQAENDLMELL